MSIYLYECVCVCVSYGCTSRVAKFPLLASILFIYNKQTHLNGIEKQISSLFSQCVCIHADMCDVCVLVKSHLRVCVKRIGDKSVSKVKFDIKLNHFFKIKNNEFLNKLNC